MLMSCMFKPEQILELHQELSEVQAKANDITEMLVGWDYQTTEGKEYGTHGLARRVTNIARCVARVYELLPPELDEIPDDDSRKDAEVFIQAAVFGIYGALENLAFVWAFERKVLERGGIPLSNVKIGFSPKKREFWASLPEGLQAYFESMRQWRVNLESFRHSLGHRIPLYIPPCVAKFPEYENLEKEKYAALGNLDVASYQALKSEQKKLCVFKPMIAHSLSNGSPPIVFHAQLLADFNTLAEACRMVFDRLKE